MSKWHGLYALLQVITNRLCYRHTPVYVQCLIALTCPSPTPARQQVKYLEIILGLGHISAISH